MRVLVAEDAVKVAGLLRRGLEEEGFAVGDPHVVNVYVGYLRDKVDRPFHRKSTETVRGMGYRLRDDRSSR